ncbi:MAG: oligosaccharide flippase family protein [Bacteroidia bacterium]|nr:oligosaccharide flippase family protein [Bacteroidia bacterium]
MKKKLIQIIKEDNFLSLSGNLVIAFFGIISFSLITRTLPLEEFGEFVIFVAGASFMEMFRFGITNTAVIRFLSGANPKQRIQIIGSNALIGLVSTSAIAILMLICNYLFENPIKQSGYGMFFSWYPLLSILNLPWNNAMVILQADRYYGKILLLKAVNSFTFFCCVVASYFFLHWNLYQLIWCMILVNLLTSSISIIAGWDGTFSFMKATKESNSQLLHFGKYTTFTLIGTNLLRSADTVIISLSPLGPTAVALYSIPIKLTEMQQIPLRSFVATAFPKMSKASLQGNIDEVRKLFYSYSGALTYLFVLISLTTFLFADLFVWIIGGDKFSVVEPITGTNVADIVRIFSIYGLLLPIDRMTGIGLDSINKPQVNAIKVFFMVAANIIGDLIAVFLFKSLLLVAVASILFTMVGIYLGLYFFNKDIPIEFYQIFKEGKQFYIQIFHQFLKKKG